MLKFYQLIFIVWLCAGAASVAQAQDIAEASAPEQRSVAVMDVQKNYKSEALRQQELLIPILGIIFVFGTPIIIVLILVWGDYRIKGRMFTTIDKAIEQGVEVPPAVLAAIEKPEEKSSSLRSGLLWAGLGLGVLVAWSIFRNFNEASLGFIPLFVGIAHLISARLEPVNNDD